MLFVTSSQYPSPIHPALEHPPLVELGLPVGTVRHDLDKYLLHWQANA